MVGYVEQNLMPGERVEFHTGMHPMAAYGPAIAFAIIGFISAFISPAILVIFAVIAVLFAIGGAIKVANTEMAVTNKRVISKAGLLSTHSLEVNLNKVEGISVHQDLGGKLFGYAKVSVNGTGGTKDGVAGIARPFELRTAVQDHLRHDATSESASATSSAAPVHNASPTPESRSAPPSTGEELERLANLRDRGALTEDEFAEQKARLLGGSS
jgi:hypothetical protein